jgi:hypothetical protein
MLRPAHSKYAIHAHIYYVVTNESDNVEIVGTWNISTYHDENLFSNQGRNDVKIVDDTMPLQDASVRQDTNCVWHE